MGFDLSTAKPIKFDLSTAKPIKDSKNIEPTETIFQRAVKAFQSAGNVLMGGFNRAVQAGPASFNSLTGGPATEFAHGVKTEALTRSGVPEFFSEAISTASDPQSLLGGMAVAKGAGNSLITGGKTASKLGRIFRSGSKPVTKRIGEVERMAQCERTAIGSMATREQEALKAQQGFQKGNILQKQSSLMQQAEDEALGMSNKESGGYQNVLTRSAERSKALQSEKTGLQSNLSTTAKSEAGEFEPRYSAHLRKMSDNWRTEVDDIAKKNGGIEVDANSIADDLENLLQNERHSILETADDGVTTGGASAVEKTILKLANRLRSKGAVTLDEALQETSAIGKGKKVGAGGGESGSLTRS